MILRFVAAFSFNFKQIQTFNLLAAYLSLSLNLLYSLPLEACNIKMLNAIYFMSGMNRKGGVDRLKVVNSQDAKGKTFF